jgi:hypothetical protein
MAAKPIATKVKYKFFRLFILSIGLMVFLYAGPTYEQVTSGNVYYVKSSSRAALRLNACGRSGISSP